MSAFSWANTIASIYLSLLTLLVKIGGVPRSVLAVEPEWLPLALAFGAAAALWLAVFFIARL